MDWTKKSKGNGCQLGERSTRHPLGTDIKNKINLLITECDLGACYLKDMGLRDPHIDGDKHQVCSTNIV